ncbi:MAG: ABC transporter permease [Alphaproteobacteria bacterium]|nr:ABC transporter permease [Alphaproteobacteria bacterium]
MPWFAPANPTVWQTYPRNRRPSLEHWLGTTNLGQDVFWLLSWATGNSLLLGVIVAFFATAIGVVLGLLAGFRGGPLDRALSFMMDATIAVPSLPILILMASILKGQASLPAIAAILVAFNWPFPARQIRSVALSMREREFVHMAWFSGEGVARIIGRQIFPYLRTWATANFINTVLVGIAVESSLAVIGLSSADQATLGTMIYWALKYQAVLAGRWWWIAPPVLAIILLFVGLFLLASGLGQRSQEARGR